MQTIFDSVDVPLRDRVEAWREATATAMVTSKITPLEPPTFEARLQAMSLGAAHLASISYASLHSHRTPKLIRQSDPELYQIALVTSGQHVIQQARRSAKISAGELILYDSGRPFDAFAKADGVRADSLVLQFPKRLLPFPDRCVASLLATPLQGQVGVGRLLADYLAGLVKEHDGRTSPSMNGFGDTAISLASAVLGHYLDRQSEMPPESHQHVSFMHARAFIDRNLSDPRLAPAIVAAACQTSTRQLQRLFQQKGLTVAGYIRHRRLEFCRQDLAAPYLAHRSIYAIAACWGFTHPEVFSRAFRAAFGLSPSDYRHTTAGAHRQEPGAHRQGLS